MTGSDCRASLLTLGHCCAIFCKLRRAGMSRLPEQLVPLVRWFDSLDGSRLNSSPGARKGGGDTEGTGEPSEMTFTCISELDKRSAVGFD